MVKHAGMSSHDPFKYNILFGKRFAVIYQRSPMKTIDPKKEANEQVETE